LGIPSDDDGGCVELAFLEGCLEFAFGFSDSESAEIDATEFSDNDITILPDGVDAIKGRVFFDEHLYLFTRT